MIFSALVALSVAAFANAQTVHPVTVGGTGSAVLTFSPPFVNAAIGDIVEFEFRQKNHTVLQTSFGNVCHPLLGDNGTPVFNTGFHPAAADQTEGFEKVQYTVGTLDPLWFYCGARTHCGQGMVFAINCPQDGYNSLQNFIDSARAFGVREQEAASASSEWAKTATPDVYHGSLTYAPVFKPTVTATVTLGEEGWTTTYESYPNSPDPTPDAAEGREHRVIVGGENGLTYFPPAIAAAPRDRIIFEFQSKNHTATQSSFGNPCRKLEFTSTTGQIGFDSGFVPVSAEVQASGEYPTYTVTVNDTAPIWVYCRQGNHCGQGMVFSVNADEASDRNHEGFSALAQTINGTGSTTPNTNNDGYGSGAVSIQIGMLSSALLAVGSLFVLAL